MLGWHNWTWAGHVDQTRPWLRRGKTGPDETIYNEWWGAGDEELRTASPYKCFERASVSVCRRKKVSIHWDNEVVQREEKEKSNQVRRGQEVGQQTPIRYQSDIGQTPIRYWSDTGQTWVRYWSHTGQTSVRHRSDTGQILVRYWSDTSQKVRNWSDTGQIPVRSQSDTILILIRPELSTSQTLVKH
jgi:hypothetical protein